VAPEELFFLYVAVSIDLFGDHRVDVKGKPSELKVLDNMQILIDEGISFGCITVLSKINCTACRTDL
jgi:uncharacterized protein